MPARTRTPLLLPVVGVLAVAAAMPQHWALQALLVIGAVVVPGAAISHALGSDRSGRAANIVLAVAYGAALMMLVGWVSSTLLGDGAYERGTQLGIYAALLVAAVAVERFRGTDTLSGIVGERPGRALAALSAAMVLPTATLIGVERLDRGNGSGAALAVFVLAAVLLAASVAAGTTRLGADRPGAVLLGLYSSALSVVWGTASRGHHLFGWDIQKEYSVATETVARGFWQAPADQDAYASMLSITSMPAQLQAITGTNVTTTLSLLYPILLALLPVAAFETIRRHASLRSATVVTAAYVIGARTFPGQMPAIGRQEVALLLFAAGLLLATDRTVGPGRRRTGAAILFGATAFSHYTTAYVTLAMVAAAGAFTWFSTRKDAERRADATFDWKVVAGVAVAVLGWNVLVAPIGTLVENRSEDVRSEGLQVLARERGDDRSLWQVWLEGGNPVVYGTPDDYARELSMLRDNRLAWMDADVHLGNVEPVRTQAPQADGLAPALRGPWRTAFTATGQLLLLLLVAGTLWSLTRGRWRRAGLPVDLAGLVIGAFAMSALLRVSGTAAEFYNPERGALHGALVLGVPAGLLLERLARRGLRAHAIAGLLGLLFAAGTWGVGAHVFGGTPPASTAEYGENSERFLVSPAELSSARWLADELGEDAFLQGDRYAQIVLLNLDRQATHGKVFILHPDFVDYDAYIFATRANVVEGRARGYENGTFAIFTSPLEGFSDLRATVYATEETRILK